MIRVKEIKVSLKTEINLNKEIAKKLKIKENEIIDYKIYRKSVDARRKDNVCINYIIDVNLKNEDKFADLKIEKIDVDLNIVCNKKIEKPPVVIGAGPAGLFAAYVLAKAGLSPYIIEQGKTVDERKEDVDKFWTEGKINPLSNVQFGEGGAGTFSDGKLTTLINNPLCAFVLRKFVENGAPEEIEYLAKPHVGTDILMKVIKNLRKEIESLGGTFIFSEKVVDIKIKENKVNSIVTNKERKIETNNVIFAIGHSARDTFEMLLSKKIQMHTKPLSVGVRIEHLQSKLDKMQYGNFAGHKELKAAEYKFVHHGRKNVYTFCMCPGGLVVASASEENTVVTNGMSYYKRDLENSNSALLVEINENDVAGDNVLKLMYFQRELEKKAFEMAGKTYNAPVQLVGDFLENRISTKIGTVKPTYKPGYTFVNLNDLFPKFVSENLKDAIINIDKKMHGFADKDAVLTAVETRSSSPVRITRDENCNSNIVGVHPCGEGAGYAGGIMSAAVDGIRVALKIIE